MAVTIEVTRGAGARDGGEILEPLLGDSLDAAIARGRAELDAHAHDLDRIEIELEYSPAWAVGVRVTVTDPELGAAWQGDIVGVDHGWSATGALTRLTLERARA